MSKLRTQPNEISYSKSDQSEKPGLVLVIKEQFFKFPGTFIRIYDHKEHLLAKTYGKPFRLREKIEIYSDEAMKYINMTSHTDKIIDFNVTFTITGIDEKVLGYVERNGWSSEFVRDSWIIRDAHNKEVGRLQEDSVKLGLVRRFVLGLLPQRYTIKTSNGSELDLIQNWNLFALRYKVYADNYKKFTNELSEQLLIGVLSTIITIEGKQR
jgi:hypothetical protein